MERLGQKSPLAQWILNHTDDYGGEYPTLRQFALACGLNQGTLNQIVDGGGPKADTLRKLAESTGERLLDLYVIAGWLTEEEISVVPAPAMSQVEIGMLEQYRGFDQKQKDAIHAMFGVLHPFESRQSVE